jgi:hypothetical protein
VVTKVTTLSHQLFFDSHFINYFNKELGELVDFLVAHLNSQSREICPQNIGLFTICLYDILPIQQNDLKTNQNVLQTKNEKISVL